MSEFKTVSIREVNGGFIVDTSEGEYIFTSFNNAIRKVKETLQPKEGTTEA